MRRRVSLCIVLRIRFGVLKISDILELLFAIWRSRLLRLVRGFRFFVQPIVGEEIVYIVHLSVTDPAHTPEESLGTPCATLCQIDASFCIIDLIWISEWMFFGRCGQRSSEKYFGVIFFEYYNWSLELLIFPILFVSDVLTERAPPDILFIEQVTLLFGIELVF